MIFFHSMKYRLICLGIALVIAGVVLRLFVALPFAQDLLQNSTSIQQLSMASYVASDIGQSLQSRHILIDRLGAMLPSNIIQQPANLARWLQERQHLNPLFDGGLLLLRPDGHGLLAQYPEESGRATQDYSNADWFRAALRSGRPAWGKPQRVQGQGEPILTIAIPVYDASRHVVAILAGISTLNMHGFIARLQTAQRETQSQFLIISPADKLIVGASNPTLVLSPVPAPGTNPLHDRAMAGYRGTGVALNKYGEEALSSIVTVPGSEWFVVTSMPTKIVFQPIEAMRTFVIKNTLIAMVVLIAILTWLLPRILRPLTNAARAIRSMADGQRPLAPLPVKLQDEVGDFLNGFNYLLARLNEKEIALKSSQTQLKKLAHHDSVTGLYNRTMLDDRLQQALVQTERVGMHFALLFCDLDNFKPINDQFGHQTGDLILQQVAERLMAGRRETDTVARFGGDEFTILLTNLYDARGAASNVAKQLLAKTSTPFIIGEQTFSISLSIGIALHLGANASASQLISQADIAMYQAKRAGKNGFHIFENELAPSTV